ncbi:BON domain-containing protein [Aestuariibaculum suncheonense]|uniref:BON domain-containing protein n=1 Tax=Aestuariibaculum suncheonense TaxID=1028745 RepID=A0A8J6UAR1_9FLAO|nr:BON domain-containing protein [Aestuariibaculum suncheonense]MBD0835588.1 BON domain-containing protein [Aestuariibaculum suncheonense]
MKTDSQIKQDVLDELAWQSNIDETQIGVIVKNGVVTLNGVVDTYAKKIAAERAAKSVFGVKAVAEDIEVDFKMGQGKSDTDIATAVVNVLKWNASLPEDKIQIKVENAWVYLTGEVEWSFQKNAAKIAVENLHGVKGVVNNIVIKQRVEPVEVKDRITKAFERSADLEAKNIKIEVDGGVVTLSGTVHSITEKEEARRATFFAPGVTKVINNLKVKFYPEYA